MRRAIIVSSVAAGALVSSVAFAARPVRVAICHLDDGVFTQIQVIQAAVPAHLSKHGDVYPGAWWPDGDGDGYGDPGAAPRACPQTGLVANDDDCDDADESVNPGAEEICDDGIDQDCDGEVDDGCAPACPCFTREIIIRHFEEERLYADELAWCSTSHYEDPFGNVREYTRLEFGSEESLGGADYIAEQHIFEALSRVNVESPNDIWTCTAYAGGASYRFDPSTGGYSSYDRWTDLYRYDDLLTAQQQAACSAILVATTADLGLQCTEEP